MGLSERKQKQRIGNDPRNLQWRQDTSSFGAQYLLKAGHVPNTSLGLTADSGLINPIAVARKLDNSGIGVGRSRKEGGTDNGGVGGAGSGLDDLLRRLASASNSGASTPVEEGSKGKVMSGFARAAVDQEVDTVVVREVEVGEAGVKETKVVVKPNRLAHRAKFRNAKSQASLSATTAMSEILGIPSQPTSSVPSPSSTARSTPQPAEDDLIAHNKDQMTVADYFKKKMEEKKAAMMKAMASAAGAGAPATSLEGSVGEGVSFDEVVRVAASSEEGEAAVGSSSSSVEVEAPVLEEGEKKKDKGKKRKRDEPPSALEGAEAEAKRLKKEEKKRKKAEKKSQGAGLEEPAEKKEESEEGKKRKKKKKSKDE